MRFPMPYSLSSVGFLIFGIPRRWPAWWRPLGKSKTKPGKHWPSGLNTPAIQLACRVTFTGLLLAPDRLAKLELLGLIFADFKLGHFSPHQCNYHSSFDFACR